VELAKRNDENAVMEEDGNANSFSILESSFGKKAEPSRITCKVFWCGQKSIQVVKDR